MYDLINDYQGTFSFQSLTNDNIEGVYPLENVIMFAPIYYHSSLENLSELSTFHNFGPSILGCEEDEELAFPLGLNFESGLEFWT